MIVSTGIINAYVSLIRGGMKTLEEVPTAIREAVEKALEAVE